MSEEMADGDRVRRGLEGWVVGIAAGEDLHGLELGEELGDGVVELEAVALVAHQRRHARDRL